MNSFETVVDCGVPETAVMVAGAAATISNAFPPTSGAPMSKLIAIMSMSLDGFVADRNDGPVAEGRHSREGVGAGGHKGECGDAGADHYAWRR